MKELNEETIEELNKNHKMVWLHDPIKYEYLRKSEFTCHDVRCKPLTKNDEKYSKWLLIGYEKPKVKTIFPDGYKLYKSIYYWLKNYDRGMPDQFIQNGYGVHTDCVPAEAVKIVKKLYV